ncbi:MAG: 23S rRNA pseudouridine(2605) synthase RluB [Gammaproteobacteria bacterium]|jgi:23S rRNA pseudouridine2605 synthase
MSHKLQKILAQNGLGSRREVEQWISAGRIKVDGEVAHLGLRIDDTAKVLLDDKPVKLNNTASEDLVLIYHKPEGELCTRHDPEGRPDVFSAIPKPKKGRFISVGRLDLNTSGLLLFTTNGELAHRLMHPSYQIEREYAVRVLGAASDIQLDQLLTGVSIDGQMAKFTRIEQMQGTGANIWYRVVILEGRQREVRRLWEAVGLTVSRLIRIRFGDIQLPKGLQKGQFEYLSPKEVELLKKSVNLS